MSKKIKLQVDKRFLNNLFEYIIAVALIINCRSIWVHLKNGADLYKYLSLFLLLIGVCGCMIIKGTISINGFRKAVKSIAFFLLYFLIFFILTPSDFSTIAHMAVAFCIISSYYFLCCDRNSVLDVMMKYANLVAIIAAVSLILWFFFSILKVGEPSGLVSITWTGDIKGVKQINTYYGLYFETQTSNMFGSLMIRNTAVFTEAPMCSLHFSIALSFILFFRSKVSKTKCLILTLGILSTFSVTGYLFVGMALGFKYILYVPHKRIFSDLKKVFIPVGVIVLAILGYSLVSEKLSSSSGSVRIDDFIIGYKAWCENLLIGEGISSKSILQNYMDSWRADNTGYSNSVMLVLVNGGLYFGIFYFYCFIKGAITAVKFKDYNLLTFEFLFLYLFTLTVIPYQYLTYFILLFFKIYKGDNKSHNLKSVKNTKKITGNNFNPVSA